MSKIAWTSSLPPWKNWEICALLFTLVYTGYIYCYQGWKKNYFQQLTAVETVSVIVAVVFLILCCLVSANWLHHLFNFRAADRRGSMLLLALTILIFVWVDFQLARAFAKKNLPRVSQTYILSLKFSDIPVLVGFALLTVYSFVLGNARISSEHMDAFFGGTVAFQMILSNIIWTLTDDVFVED